MSESEDDGAFESADEGESNTPSPKKQSKKSQSNISSEPPEDKPDSFTDNAPETENPSSVVDETTEAIEKLKVSEVPDDKKDSKSSESPVKPSAPRSESPITQSPQAETIERGTSKEEERKINVLEKLSDAATEKQSGWGWGGIGSWGSQVMSSATTFTNQVGEGFTQVLESVESSLGAPTPEEAAEMEAAEKKEKEDKEKEKLKQEEAKKSPEGQEGAGGDSDGGAAGGWGGGWGWGGISGITNVLKETVHQTASVVQSTTDAVTEKSQKLVTGSLDVLETIGKKTYDVIAEGDHGLKSTINQARDKPNLSVLLREAKDDADKRGKQEEEFAEARKAHFGAQFDDFQGLAHLEALEMLSNQCEAKVQSLLSALPGEKVEAVKPELVSIKTSFELEDIDEEDDEDDDKDHDFDRIMADYIGQLGLKISPEKMIQAQEKGRKKLMDFQTDEEDDIGKSPKVLHEAAIQSLAEVTANAVGLFHKVGQLLLAEKAPLSSYKTKATSLASVTKTVCTEVGILSGKYTQQLNTAAEKSEDPNEINPLITNVYLEATNSSTYIQDAFQLVLPAMQQSALEAFTTQDSSES